jgi:hypothetical protein
MVPYKWHSATDVPKELEVRLRIIEAVGEFAAQGEEARINRRWAEIAACRRELTEVELAVQELKRACDPRLRSYVNKYTYNPDEPRVPAGNAGGGQWTSSGGGSSSISAIEPVDDANDTSSIGTQYAQQETGTPADDSGTSDDRLKLPPGQHNDELADLLEWIANATPQDELAIRAEIKRLYYDAGDTLGYNALNAALSDVLEPGTGKDTRQAILDGIAPYANTDAARGQSGALLSAAALLLLGIIPPAATLDVASVAWELGWAVRGIYFSERLGANLPATFPVIDSFVDGVATSIKSIDLDAAIYQDVARLTYRLNTYIDEVALFDGAELGTIEIKSTDITGRALSLAIPKGSMTAVQKAAIDAARARAQALDVDLIITTF